MNKSRFIELIRDPNKVLEKDLIQLSELAAQYPYSQVLHILKAKGSKKLEQGNSQKALHLAAVYSADRRVLKTVIEEKAALSGAPVIETPPQPANFDWIEQELKDDAHTPLQDSAADPQADQVSEDTSIEEETKDGETGEISTEPLQTTEITVKSTHEPETVAEESPADTADMENEASSQVWEELQHLERKEEEFEPPLEEESLVESKTAADEEVPDNIGAPEDFEASEDAGIPDDAGAADTAEEHGALEEELDLHIAADMHEKSIHEELMDNLSKLKESRQQFRENPDFETDADDNDNIGDNKQEQIEIIDNFIKNSPLLSKPDLSAESEATSQKDLSKKSAVFHDDMASEQLAKILAKQGNKKDAIKIYEKLISKFPKKKSYFAGQIENLRKK